MAILNIKNFPDDQYEALRRLAEAEHRSVAQQVIHLIAAALGTAQPRSILELRGLGKELWSDVDPDEHVETERRSWR